MSILDGILTKEQRAMGMTLSEDDHLVYLKKGAELLSVHPALSVTFAELQKSAHNHEQWAKSGIEVVKCNI